MAFAGGNDLSYSADHYTSTGTYYENDIPEITRTTMGQPIVPGYKSIKIPPKPWWRKVLDFFTVNGKGIHRKPKRWQ